MSNVDVDSNLIAKEVKRMGNGPFVTTLEPPFNLETWSFDMLKGMLADFNTLTEHDERLRKKYLAVLNHAILKCYTL